MTAQHPTWIMKYVHASKVNAVKIVTWQEHHEIATIRDVYTWKDQPSEGAKNAALIAATPDLLTALEDAEFLLRKLAINPHEATAMTDSMRRSAEDARAAIAKARGETA